MILRADHLAGAAFIGLALLVFALSGDLPMGQLSMPGSGFMPKLVAALMIVLGAALILGARDSHPLATLDWSDVKHALGVLLIAAAATALYRRFGFIITMALMMIGLLVLVERRNPLRAALYSFAVVAATYGVFTYALKSPLPTSPWGF